MTSKPPTSRISPPKKSTYVPSRLSDDAEHEAADDGAERTVEPAEHGGRERVQQDAAHHVRVEEDRRRGHHPRERAEHGGDAPSRARASS